MPTSLSPSLLALAYQGVGENLDLVLAWAHLSKRQSDHAIAKIKNMKLKLKKY